MKNVKFSLIAASLALALGNSFATAATLQAVVADTLQSNPEVLITTNDRLAVEQELKGAHGGYLPTLDLNLGYGVEESNNPTTRATGSDNIDLNRGEAEIIARQMLFDGFATSNEVDRQQSRVNSRAYTVAGTANETALRTAEVYVQYLRRKELVDLAKLNLDAHEKTFQQIKLRSERGVDRKADLDQTQGRLALAKSNLMAEESNLREAEVNYVAVVGVSPENLERPVPAFDQLPKNLPDAIKQAQDQHPTLKSAGADINAAHAQYMASRSLNLPRVHLELSATEENNLDGIRGTNEDAQAMLRMRYNLFNGSKDLARKRETANLINEAKEIRNRTCRQVVESMRLSWNNYETVNRQMDYFKQHLESSERARDAYQKQFSIGQRTLLDLLDSENELFEARSAYTNGVYDKIFAAYRILASKGQIVSSLGLKDPTEAAQSDYVAGDVSPDTDYKTWTAKPVN